jgi:hypothetical protein
MGLSYLMAALSTIAVTHNFVVPHLWVILFENLHMRVHLNLLYYV